MNFTFHFSHNLTNFSFVLIECLTVPEFLGLMNVFNVFLEYIFEKFTF